MLSDEFLERVRQPLRDACTVKEWVDDLIAQAKEANALRAERDRLRSEAEALRREAADLRDELAARHGLILDLKAKQEQLVTALRGGTGITFDDGVSVNVAALQAEHARLSALAGLALSEFRSVNVARCEQGFRARVDEWSPTDWGCALAGEVGELCNLVKKVRRGEDVPMQDIGDEAADVLTYLDLLCARFGIDLERALVKKFNEVSDRVGCDVKLDESRYDGIKKEAR